MRKVNIYNWLGRKEPWVEQLEKNMKEEFHFDKTDPLEQDIHSLAKSISISNPEERIEQGMQTLMQAHNRKEELQQTKEALANADKEHSEDMLKSRKEKEKIRMLQKELSIAEENYEKYVNKAEFARLKREFQAIKNLIEKAQSGYDVVANLREVEDKVEKIKELQSNIKLALQKYDEKGSKKGQSLEENNEEYVFETELNEDCCLNLPLQEDLLAEQKMIEAFFEEVRPLLEKLKKQ
jgi:vacuolar-type H+-ATPase catalytic subunit A/Vma1